MHICKQHSTGTGTFNNKYIIIIIENILPFAIGSNSLANILHNQLVLTILKDTSNNYTMDSMV